MTVEDEVIRRETRHLAEVRREARIAAQSFDVGGIEIADDRVASARESVAHLFRRDAKREDELLAAWESRLPIERIRLELDAASGLETNHAEWSAPHTSFTP